MRQQWSRYRAQGWLEGAQADAWVDGGAGQQLAQQQDLQSTFDAAGNRVRVTNYKLVDGVRIVDRQGLYAYDGAGRMTRGVDGASGVVVDGLVHDGHGNRVRERRGDRRR